MTGTIPGFIDVVLNFGSSQLDEDNLVDQWHRANRNIIFYGDDTWLRLFPNQFKRREGTTSFFVSDFTEVIVILAQVIMNWTMSLRRLTIM